MPTQLFLLLLYLLFPYPSSSSSITSNMNTLNIGSHLSVENLEKVLVSSNGVFASGFHSIGDNAYCFAIWFTVTNNTTTPRRTLVWVANRDRPVNGKRSKLTLRKNGKLDLIDADRTLVWSTQIVSISSVELHLKDSGNLVLRNKENVVLWQSFDSPTDTLLPQQNFTEKSKLISSRSKDNISSGFYQLFFDNDNVIHLLYTVPEVSSLYWPSPWLKSWEAGRSTYNNSRMASLDRYGEFTSSDNLRFKASDNGVVLQRRLTLDYDGNLRLYSRDERTGDWSVTWEALINPCIIHGACGPSSLCSYDTIMGRKCFCPPSFKVKNPFDLSYGCEPEFNMSCSDTREVVYQKHKHVEFYGYDNKYYPNITLSQCKDKCSQSCTCKGFQFKPVKTDSGNEYISNCYTKTLLLNGYLSPSFRGDFYIKIPKTKPETSMKESKLHCVDQILMVNTTFPKTHVKGILKSMLWFAIALGGVEVIVIFIIWITTIGSRKESITRKQGYMLAVAATGFKRFAYSELKQATTNFRQEIGRGAGGTVYKGVLSDDRVVAVKRLHESNQKEDEFLAEVSIIGKMNHMNLIGMLGYCAEKAHKLLVYEFMEHGSLAQNLQTRTLDWEKRYEIAVGTAKGLAYIHEECLEWVLHCDVKPQNILLDSMHRAKVSDFGLSKILNRSGLRNSDFSKIRGTRGYMAPEWVFNMPITSKVDVYSYGVVLLELLTGKSPTAENSGEETENRKLVTRLRENMNGGSGIESFVEEIVDPVLKGKYEMDRMNVLIAVAIQCLEEDKDERPTMSQVVDMLLPHQHEEEN